MIHCELVVSGRPIVTIERQTGSNAGAWARIQEAMARGVVGGDSHRIDVRADVFLAELEAVRDARNIFNQSVEFGAKLRLQLQSLASDSRLRETALNREPISLETLRTELTAAGFTRDLKQFQLRNLAKILSLPHGADFSVPGAGKTTVALANFTLGRKRGDVLRALVVAPIAAFSAWKDDAHACVRPLPKIVVHAGRGSIIPANTDILLSNYNRVAADYDRIRAFVSQVPTQVFLDEAHRVKRGADGVHGRAVLDLAYAAKRRDVLTGTPAPQGAYDLVALMRFLYPGQDRRILPPAAYAERDGRDLAVLKDTNNAVSRYFVRTTKSELSLPPTRFIVEHTEMGPIQQAIYSALIGQYRASFALDRGARREFDRLGRIVMYLLEAATNPMLLLGGSDYGDDPAFEHPPLELEGCEPLADLLSKYNRYETPWKYQRVYEIVSNAAQHGQKILVWSNFVRNIKALSRHLAPFAPAMVHGGVPSIEETSQPTVLSRERELDRFKNDPTCHVLLANPAACGEGVSLHHWCHHAVYLDRSFNAGHFLQSQDRIHRLGLDERIETNFTLLISSGSIDESVDGRLREKVAALAHLMGDPGLVQLALPEVDELTTEGLPTSADDYGTVIAHLQSVLNAS
ncbi:TPA: DEAD/DEAH box helicase [Burkholderia cenocepacia]|nr:DEAD/DEAH box helicase [Burkholderia cenocepacia]HDR9814944.1 DEAD/DEAH box helicase [Burkholderia cenocepacia]HDR9817245.1 DEAD/DEAH box helicase [Burkholderia cenocepacia]HDR9832354.1 DEAD/DEAH box helicase [Burkholderia cenocepacia]